MIVLWESKFSFFYTRVSCIRDYAQILLLILIEIIIKLMVTIRNEIQWISMAVTFRFCNKAVVKISQKQQKNTCTGIFILIMLEALGQEEFKGEFKIFYCTISSMENIPNVFSYVHQQFLKRLIFGDKRLTKATTKICIFKKYFLLHDLLDMPKYFSNQLIIIHEY